MSRMILGISAFGPDEVVLHLSQSTAQTEAPPESSPEPTLGPGCIP